MTDETRKLLVAMLVFLESRKSAIKSVLDYMVSEENEIGEQYAKGRLVEIDYVIWELKHDLRIPIEVGKCEEKKI